MIIIVGGVRARISTAVAAGKDNPVRILARFAVERDGGPIVIPVSLQVDDKRLGQREVALRMAVDTGTTRTTFDPRHRPLLGAPVGKTTIKTVAGQVESETFKAPRLRYGPISAQPVDRVTCRDLRPESLAVGETIDGLLGMDLLCLHVISINSDRGEVDFYATAGPQFGTAIPLVWDHAAAARIPHISVDLGGGIRERFEVDTGFIWSAAGTLSELAAIRLTNKGMLFELAANEPAKLFVLQKGVDGRVVRLPCFNVAGHRHQNLLFATMPHSRLGTGFLSRYIVTFDFPNSVMYIRSGKGYSRVDAGDASGLQLERDEGSVRVSAVDRTTAADVAGLIAGDRILAIDNESVYYMSLSAVRRRLSGEGRRVLNVRRAGAEFKVALDLPELSFRVAEKRSELENK